MYTQDYKAELRVLFDCDLSKYITKLLDDKDFYHEFLHRMASAGRYLGNFPDPEMLYAICRHLKPSIVIETGVASGVSSLFVLKALTNNKHGKLYSIDQPDWEDTLGNTKKEYHDLPSHGGNLPDEKESGWIVPDNLKSRWVLTLGLSTDKLLPLIKRLGMVELFIHDSEHTCENMIFEFQTVWPFISPGGILIADDIQWNDAFREFRYEMRNESTSIMLDNRVGIIRKIQ